MVVNPEGVASPTGWPDATPSGLLVFVVRRPRVAPPAQPWALGRNPLGVSGCIPYTFGIYFLKCYLEHVKQSGGVEAVEAINRKKQELVYQTMDESGGFYRGTVEKDSRSWMNITMRLPSEESLRTPTSLRPRWRGSPEWGPCPSR